MVGMVRQIVPIVTNSAAFRKFVELLEHTGGEHGNLLRVLTYHRVDEPTSRPWLDTALISASPQVFETQMKYLAANYQPVSVFDVMDAFKAEGRKALPARAVLVTFDDAYSDFEQHAWPVLRHYRIPSTLFVPTAFPDHPERVFWWDRLFDAIHITPVSELNTPIGTLPISTAAQRGQALIRLKSHLKALPNDAALAEIEQLCSGLGVSPHHNCVLGWDALRRLAGEGVVLGAHTQTHPIMKSISIEEMHNEVKGSLHDLRRQIGFVPPVFAYPSGMYNEAAVRVVERVGFKLAFTTERGINDVGNADPLRLRRINIGTRTTLPVLRAQLLSWSAPLYRLARRIPG